jgi:16S rRNA (guanine1207-N2)-methyltransferase
LRDYFALGVYTVDVGGRSLSVAGKPGVWSWDRLNPGTAALLEVADLDHAETALDLGCGTGVIGLFAGQTGARVVLVDSSVPAARSARETVAHTPGLWAEVRLGDGVRNLEPAAFDLVLSHLPRGRLVQEELIDGAAWVLRPGGRFYFVAHRRAGIKSAIRHASARFGRCAVVRQKQGYHVALCELQSSSLANCPWTPHSRKRITCDGRDTVVVGKPGVFAWDRLDDGTAALISSIEVGRSDRVLDLGCGTGLAGLAAATRADRGFATLVDGDVRAVEAARLTLKANGVANAGSLLSDCAQAVHEQRFDVVVTNPPFHRGIGTQYDVAYQFVRDAQRVLRKGGRFYLVANRHLRYREHVVSVFGNATTCFSDSRYQVLRAEVP